MTDTVKPLVSRPSLGIRQGLLAMAALLLLVGLTGFSHAAVGFGFFLVAGLLVGMGVCLLAIFSLTRWFATEGLRRAYAGAFLLGAWGYVFAVSSMAGYYVHEAVAGRIEWKYMLFGPAALAAIMIIDIGIWRVIVKRNLLTVQRFGDLWSREALDRQALRRTLLDEVVLHRTLFGISPFRWVRHQLIFWGFGAMFLLEFGAVAFREAFPSFGWTDLWDQPDHPLRLAFDFAFDLTGLMVLAGCVLALVFRAMSQGREAQKYTDTPTAVFLLAVVVTGFMVEGMRLTLLAAGVPGTSASFVGLVFAAVLPASVAWHDSIWTTHALLACAFIAYVPLKRLIHSCATPIGRLANSQTALLSEKKRRSISGLMRRSG